MEARHANQRKRPCGNHPRGAVAGRRDSIAAGSDAGRLSSLPLGAVSGDGRGRRARRGVSELHLQRATGVCGQGDSVDSAVGVPLSDSPGWQDAPTARSGRSEGAVDEGRDGRVGSAVHPAHGSSDARLDGVLQRSARHGRRPMAHDEHQVGRDGDRHDAVGSSADVLVCGVGWSGVGVLQGPEDARPDPLRVWGRHVRRRRCRGRFRKARRGCGTRRVRLLRPRPQHRRRWEWHRLETPDAARRRTRAGGHLPGGRCPASAKRLGRGLRRERVQGKPRHLRQAKPDDVDLLGAGGAFPKAPVGRAVEGRTQVLGR